LPTSASSNKQENEIGPAFQIGSGTPGRFSVGTKPGRAHPGVTIILKDPISGVRLQLLWAISTNICFLSTLNRYTISAKHNIRASPLSERGRGVKTVSCRKMGQTAFSTSALSGNRAAKLFFLVSCSR
jgi:hypothetical protein